MVMSRPAVTSTTAEPFDLQGVVRVERRRLSRRRA